jgi:hypothetical protein
MAISSVDFQKSITSSLPINRAENVRIHCDVWQDNDVMLRFIPASRATILPYSKARITIRKRYWRRTHSREINT